MIILFFTKGQNEDVTGFHTHTYGKAEGDAKPLFYSQIQRMNYGDVNKKNPSTIFSQEPVTMREML